MFKELRIKKSNIIKIIIFLVIITMALYGCASIRNALGIARGQLIGQNFDITVYNDYAHKTLQINGKNVNIELLDAKENIDESMGFKSSVLEITIDGKQTFQVGNTMIFAEKGLKIVEDYEIPDEIDTEGGFNFIPFDRFVNDLKNKIGGKKTIIISSSMGIPIGVFEGDKVYVEVPDDLPKMTRLNIDGKSLYIHRANYMILDTALLGD